jgi:hypothetical protein
MSAKAVAIVAALFRVALTCLNLWALFLITDMKTDIREIRTAATASSTALTSRIDAVGQDMTARFRDLASSGVTMQALQSKEGQSLSAAIFETRAAVSQIQTTTNDSKVILAALQTDIGNLTKTVAFMQGQVSQAPWIRK